VPILSTVISKINLVFGVKKINNILSVAIIEHILEGSAKVELCHCIMVLALQYHRLEQYASVATC